MHTNILHIFFAPDCGENSDPAGSGDLATGQLTIYLTDAPAAAFDSVNIIFSEVSAHIDSQWVTVRSDSLLKRMTARGFYKTFNALTAEPMPENTGDFRLLDRRVVDRLHELPERTRFMKGLFAWLGFSSIAVPYDRPGREEGESAWSYWKLWNHALEGLTSFSTLPLRVWTYVGLTVSLLSFVYASFLVFRTLVFGVDLPGYASLMVVILFLGGIQLISLGVIGEYLGRVFIEVKQRPVYLVNRVHQFASDDRDADGDEG